MIETMAIEHERMSMILQINYKKLMDVIHKQDVNKKAYWFSARPIMFQNLRAAASTRQDLQGDLPSVEDKEEEVSQNGKEIYKVDQEVI